MSWLGTLASFGECYKQEKEALQARKERLIRITEEEMLARVLGHTKVKDENGKAKNLPFIPCEAQEGEIARAMLVNTRTAKTGETVEEVLGGMAHIFRIVKGDETAYCPEDKTITVEEVEKKTLQTQVDLARAVATARRHVENEKVYGMECWAKDPSEWTAAEAWTYFNETVMINRTVRRTLGSSASAWERFQIWWNTRKMNGSAFLTFLKSLNPFKARQPKPQGPNWLKRSLIALLDLGIGCGISFYGIQQGLALAVTAPVWGYVVAGVAAAIGVSSLVAAGCALCGCFEKKAGSAAAPATAGAAA